MWLFTSIKIRAIKAIILILDAIRVKVSLFDFIFMDLTPIIQIFDWIILFRYFKIVILMIILMVIAIALELID